MAIHNDMLLFLLAPFYFIHDGPETLLVIQSVVLALGAVAVFAISKHVFFKNKYEDIIALIFTIVYLLNPLIQYTNIYEFHSVTLSTTFLLFLFYFWLKKRYKLSFLFFVLSVLTKEQVPLTTAFLSLYIIYKDYQESKKFPKFGLLLLGSSIAWFLISVKMIIPHFRLDDQYHFALEFYGDFGNTPTGVILGVLLNPIKVLLTILSPDRLNYFFMHFGYSGFVFLLSPLTFLITLPEYAINVLSSYKYMHNIKYHYSAVITPFMFISTIYGSNFLLKWLKKYFKKSYKDRYVFYILAYIVLCTIILTFTVGPFTEHKDMYSFADSRPGAVKISQLKEKYADEELKISTTGYLAPFFTNRRYFYDFASVEQYSKADYVIISKDHIYHGWGSKWLTELYETLKMDSQFKKIYDQNEIEVYEKIENGIL
jgi:uncharacterized membrane protein